MRHSLRNIFIIVCIIISIPYTIARASSPIQVIINGQYLSLDQPPVIEQGRALLPMRGIFESLGAQVEWNSKTQTVTGKKDNTTLRFQIENKIAYINDRPVIMDVPGKIINGRTMVPVRFIAENFGVGVEWQSQKGLVIITTLKSEGIQPNESSNTIERDDTTYKNSNLKDDYIEMKIYDNNKIEIAGKTLSDNQFIWIRVLDKNEKECWSREFRIKSDRTFRDVTNINLKEGDYTIGVYMNTQRYGTYRGVYVDIPLQNSSERLHFPPSAVYTHNLEQLSKNNQVKPEHLNLRSLSQEQENKLFQLASSIIVGKQTDYDKVLGICEWVSDNIYYDYDVLASRKYGKIDAIGTLEEKRSVCVGYSELTAALVKSIGIPAKIVTGYALGIDTAAKSWEKVNPTERNHAWNEVFINGRWVIIDTTWNSQNKYEKGKYTKKDKQHQYFDVTPEFFSYTHRIMER